ncbi:MAG: amino acid racemase [Lachnospiraceae bacterium]
MSEKTKLKKLGVIGGMGPEATSYYYEKVIEHTQAACDQDHIDMIILSHATMPDRTKAIVTGEDKVLIETLTEDAKTLEKLGASHIAIPCNTSHYYYDKIQEAVKVPIINMIQQSILYAVNRYEHVKKIGIMGTDGTIRAGTYHRECEKMGIVPVVPSKERQEDVMSLIYEEIKSGKKGSLDKFIRVFNELKANGCDVVILACTEISVFKEDYEIPDICLDAMDVLVKESIERSGASYQ